MTPTDGTIAQATSCSRQKKSDKTHRSKDHAWVVLAESQPLLVAEKVLHDTSMDGRVFEFLGGNGEGENDRVRLVFHAESRELLARTPQGERLTVIPGYWFALSAFFPHSFPVEAGNLRTVEP